MKAVVIHSGGMDSSLCLAKAIAEHGKDAVLSLSFRYGQRHSQELKAAEKICHDWQVSHVVIELECLTQLTSNSLTDSSKLIQIKDGVPSTLVVGRNGLMARLGAIHADSLGADCIYMGVIEVESANSGYRDCTRHYMDLLENILQIDLDNPNFRILTPLVYMTKAETMAFGYGLGVLPYLLKNTITCYQGIGGKGCGTCPACKLRNAGVDEFYFSTKLSK